jgi:hypothetical protein
MAHELCGNVDNIQEYPMIDPTSTYIAASIASLGFAIMILPMLYVTVRASSTSAARRNVFTEVVVRHRHPATHLFNEA